MTIPNVGDASPVLQWPVGGMTISPEKSIPVVVSGG